VQTTNQTVSFPNITAGDTVVVTNLAQTLLAKTHVDPIIAEDLTTPSAPASGVKLFSTFINNDERLATVAANGNVNDLQVALYSKIVSVLCPTPNSATVNSIGPLTYAGTTLVLKGLALNYRDWSPRIGVMSTTTTNSLSSLRGGTNLMFIRGNGGGIGGFYIKFTFGRENTIATASANMFIGLINSTSSPGTTHPRGVAANRLCGLSIIGGQTNWQFITKRNGVGQFTEVDTGVNALVNDTANRYILTMWCNSTDTVIYWSLVSMPSGTVLFNTSASTTLPETNVYMMPHVWTWNATSTTAYGTHIYNIYSEINVT
jgi:hypothetical protein